MSITIKSIQEIQKILKSDSQRQSLVSHPVLKKMKEKHLTKNQVSTIVGQYYYPIENFCFFLSASISHMKNTSIQTFISDILHEELGCGNPEESHLDLYISTCIDSGIDKEVIVDSPIFKSTKNLVEGYKKSVKKQNSALGFLYATEVADLVMVSSIGTAIANLCNKTIKDLPWVDIHVQQEPNHVNKVDSSLNLEFSEEEFEEILFSARSMWNLWIEFFNELEQKMKV